MDRPGRPLGVALAIVASVVLFSLIPLLQVGAVLLVRQHFAALNFPQDGPQPMAVGGDFLGVPVTDLVIQSALALFFLVVAVMTWRGRPPSIRYAFIMAVLSLALLRNLVWISRELTAVDPSAGLSSMDGMSQTLSVGRLLLDVLVTTYVIWYLNRGPARAFFRGRYLSPPMETGASPISGASQD